MVHRDSSDLAEAYGRWVARQLDSPAGRHVGAAIIEPLLQASMRCPSDEAHKRAVVIGRRYQVATWSRYVGKVPSLETKGLAFRSHQVNSHCLPPGTFSGIPAVVRCERAPPISMRSHSI